MSSTNKVALITGGSRGIGLGIAIQLIKEGWDVAINGVRPKEAVEEVLDQLAALSQKEGQRILYCQGNVALEEDRQKMLTQLTEEMGSLNALINNAGVAPKQRLDILETTEESYERVMDINLKGPFFLTQAVAHWLIQQKSVAPEFPAFIINISSISATVASYNRGEYCLSKSGMSMMTQLFAARLGEEHIPVYEVRPGITMTDMTSVVKEKYDHLIENGLTLQKRWGYPEDIGKAVAALVRGDFPYSTGQVIMVDGGLTIPRL